MFKDQKWIEIPWKQEEYDEAIQWAKDTLKLIEKESLWLPNQDYYYCNYLCGQRNNACEFKPQPISKKSNDDEYYDPNEQTNASEVRNISDNLITYAQQASERLKFDFPYDIQTWINSMNMMMENYQIGRAHV